MTDKNEALTSFPVYVLIGNGRLVMEKTIKHQSNKKVLDAREMLTYQSAFSPPGIESLFVGLIGG
ncbi:MAG: hypothetical protein KKD44_25845 [Proteobacteria bacterium]|nr:hypothetical protein [Pseudomonadota bacterium]